MTRGQFLSQLRQGLWGMAQQEIDLVLADYEAHFDEGLGLGRSEAEVARALGDPGGLAREYCHAVPTLVPPF